jgi:glycosyltransferase involved in cell wall biosynthesis
VISPASFRHFGIAYGNGIVQNVRANPGKALLLPLFMAAYARAARAGARHADLVHAHWLPSGIAARATGKPYVLQVWGTDVELARRVPRLARWVVRDAALVVAASAALAEDARRLGAGDVRLVPSGVDFPDDVPEPQTPPHVLYLGRLSAEKGLLDFLQATKGLPRVIVGDGPLRSSAPESVGFVPPAEVGDWIARASIVCVPSHREGYGMTAREAMAFGRPVVATGVGGLVDAISDGVDGVLVPPRDPVALRTAIERLLGDAEERTRLGANARERARESFSRTAETRALLAAYAAVAT